MEFEKICEIIAEQMGISKEEITGETNFTEDLGADSLDLFQIISELEQEFNLEFSDEDSKSVKTVDDAVRFVKKALNQE